MRYSGSSATPRCSENGRWHGKFAAVAMSIRIGCCDPSSCCSVLVTGTRGGVNANHWSSLRLGWEAKVAPSGRWADVDGEHQSEWLDADIGPGRNPLQHERLAVHEVAVLFV